MAADANRQNRDVVGREHFGFSSKRHHLPKARPAEHNDNHHPHRTEINKSGTASSTSASPNKTPLQPEQRAYGPTRRSRAASNATGESSHSPTRENHHSMASNTVPTRRSHIPIKARSGPAESRPNGMASRPQDTSTPLTPNTRAARERGSSSSPPRGLKEAYDRIVDEEKLAAEESAHDEVTDEHEGFSQEWSQLHGDHPEGQGHGGDGSSVLEPPSPALSLPSHRGSSVPRHQHNGSFTSGDRQPTEDSTLGSGSGSVVSGLSSLENGTDDSLVRTLAQHARDQRRVNGALRTGSPVFGKARVGKRAGLTSENLQRKDKIESIQAIEKETAKEAGSGSAASDFSDPPVHVPRGWGKRSRRSHDWMSKINEGESGAATERANTPDRSQDHTQKARSTQHEESSIDWLAAGADTPAASVPRASIESEGRAQHDDTEDDFPTRPRHVSTSPKLVQKPAALDFIREREIEAVKGRAVATSRLGELKERVSKEQLWSRQSISLEDNKGDEKHSNTNDRRRSTASDTQERSARRRSVPETANGAPSADSKEDGDAIPDTPVVVYRHSRGDNKSGSGSQGSAEERSNPEDTPSTSRPGKKRSDSRDLLLKLARAASNTPSPPHERQVREWPEQSNDTSKTHKQLHTEKEENDPDEPFANGKATKTAVADGNGCADARPATTEEDRLNTVNQTPAMAVGGWVDTPATAIRQDRRNGHHASSVPDVTNELKAEDEDSTLDIGDFIRGPKASPLYRRSTTAKRAPTTDLNRPVRPVDRLQRTKSVPSSSSVSKHLLPEWTREPDSTIDSLDDLLADHPELAMPKPDIDTPGIAELEDLYRRPLTQAERNQQLEKITYERMNHRLQALRLSIRGARRGIEGLESKVENSADASLGLGKREGDGAVAGEPSFWHCPECGYFVPIAKEPVHCHDWHIKIPKLPFPTIYRRQGRKIRFTWFGLLCFILLTYILAEWTTWYVFPDTSDFSSSQKFISNLVFLHYCYHYY